MALNTITHKNILVRILKDIFTNASIGPILGFKGGTAVFLFHQLSRFSVDIDLDLLDLEKTDLVFNTIKQILSNYGTIKQADNKRHSLLFILSYENKTPGDQNLKVEINLRDFNSKYEILSFLGISMKVMTKEDMFAHKLCAMYERMERANRDIFDVHYFLSNNWALNKYIVETRMNMSLKDSLQRCIQSLEKLTNHKILSGMGELLDDKQKAWVKSKLVTETIFLLRLKLEEYQ